MPGTLCRRAFAAEARASLRHDDRVQGQGRIYWFTTFEGFRPTIGLLGMEIFQAASNGMHFCNLLGQVDRAISPCQILLHYL